MTKDTSEIYPEELELKHENEDNDQHASYLDLNIDVVNQELITYLYHKRDDFPFKIVNFSDLSGNIPKKSSYGVFIAQLLRYARACVQYTDFIERTLKQHFNETIHIKQLVRWIQESVKGKIMNKHGHDTNKMKSDLITMSQNNPLYDKRVKC